MRKLLVLLSAVALIVAFTMPVAAADKEVSFYGQVWMDTYMESKSLGDLDDDDLRWNLNDNGTSRFGANFKWGNMSANAEIRPLSASMYRQWWGAWDFGRGNLLVGHTWSPLYVYPTITNQSHAGGSMGGIGFWVGDLRQAQIRLTFGNLILALVEPSTNHALLADSEFDTTLPKLEAVYTAKLGPLTLVPFLGYQTYDEVDTTTDNSYGIDGMVYGLTAKAAFGPGYVKGQLWKAQNGKEWGDLYNTGFGAFYDAVEDDIADEDSTGYGITAGMKLSDMMSFEVGYGSSTYELDRSGTWETEASGMYAQLTINLAEGFMLVPEIGKKDYEATAAGSTAKESDLTYYGATWKIHF
jgi:hypothetical protein